MIYPNQPDSQCVRDILIVSPTAGEMIERELRKGLGPSRRITSISEADVAARHVFSDPDFDCELAIIDVDLPWPGTAELLILLTDCYPGCPVILTQNLGARAEYLMLEVGRFLK